jgi:hypothetical protein
MEGVKKYRDCQFF